MEIFIIENNDKKKSEYATQCRKPGKKINKLKQEIIIK